MGTKKFSWDQLRGFADGEDRLARQKREESSVSTPMPETQSTVYFTRQRPGSPADMDSEVDIGAASWEDQHSSSACGVGKMASVADSGVRQRNRTFVRSSAFHGRGRTNRSVPGSPPVSQQRRRAPPMCGWCGRVGHSEADCWLKQGACLSCGDDSHDSRSCPKNEDSDSALQLQCSVCGGDHLGKDCTVPHNVLGRPLNS